MGGVRCLGLFPKKKTFFFGPLPLGIMGEFPSHTWHLSTTLYKFGMVMWGSMLKLILPNVFQTNELESTLPAADQPNPDPVA